MSEKPWLQSYPEGVLRTLSIQPATLIELLENSAKVFSNKTAILFFGKKIKYWKLEMLVKDFAAGLQKLGLNKGDRVAICLPNCPQSVIAYFGILYAGGIIVPCNPTYTEYELSHQIKDAGAKMIIVLDYMYEKVKQVPVEKIIVTSITEYLPFFKKLLAPLKMPSPPAIPHTNQTVFFKDVLKLHIPLSHLELTKVKPGDTAILQYTGGTTGAFSKGAELTHANLFSNVVQLRAWFKNIWIGDEKFLAALPLFHVFGMTVTQNVCLSAGGIMVLIPDPKRHNDLKDGVRQSTVLTFVPKLFQTICDICDTDDLRHLHYSISGGAGLPSMIAEAFFEKFGHRIVEGYGLSEASPVTHCNLPENPESRPCIGYPIPNTEVRIVDDTGHDVSIGEVGELWVRGPQVMKGYWNNSEETAKSLTLDGWLKTGDMARMNEQGLFYIIDRKKNVILSSTGFNVYPSEVEEALMRHPAVQEAAVIGIPTDKGNEEIKAFIVLKTDTKTQPREFLNHCRKFLAYYKIPKIIEFRSELPRTIIGKILHRTLREEEIKKRNPIQL